MSEQRKMRADLRQGLHQFLMQLFFSYNQTMDKKMVVEQIAEILNEQHQYFTGVEMKGSSTTIEELEELAKKYEQKAKSSAEYEEQMRYHEDLDILLKARDILAKERGM